MTEITVSVELENEMFLTGFGYERTSDIKPNMNFYNE